MMGHLSKGFPMRPWPFLSCFCYFGKFFNFGQVGNLADVCHVGHVGTFGYAASMGLGPS